VAVQILTLGIKNLKDDGNEAYHYIPLRN